MNVFDAFAVQVTVEVDPTERTFDVAEKLDESTTAIGVVGSVTSALSDVDGEAAITALGKIALLMSEVSTVVPDPEHADPG